jgi:hypothetical protein
MPLVIELWEKLFFQNRAIFDEAADQHGKQYNNKTGSCNSMRRCTAYFQSL